MKPKILVARPIFEETLARLRSHFEVTDNQADAPWTPEAWAHALSEHDGALTTAADPANEAVLAQVANQNAPVPGFVIVNLLAEYQYNKNFAVFGRVDNLFGSNYSNFGNFGDASGTLGPAFNNPRFYGPGSPTGGWAGFRVSF